MKKLNLLAIAAALVIGGAGGSVGSAAMAVVSYDQHAKDIAALAGDKAKVVALVESLPAGPQHDPVKVQLVTVANDIEMAVQSFQSIDVSAKDAFNRATKPPGR